MNYKTCTNPKCKRTYPATEKYFHTRKDVKGGLYAECKLCKNKKRKIRYDKDKAAGISYDKEKAAKWRAENPDYQKKWWAANKHTMSDYHKKRYSANKEQELIRGKQWRIDNPNYSKRYYYKNKDRMRMNAITKDAKKRALKKEQLINLTKEERSKVKIIYKKSHELGIDWQVDHIIPLSRGGLHSPDNLQIVTQKYNGSKSNKLESEFRSPRPCEIYKVEF